MVTNKLSPGDIVGDTNRTVVFSSKVRDGEPGETYPCWIALCQKSGEYHPYVVWEVIDRPEGWYACSGKYFHDLKQAIECYRNRGGH